MHNTVLAIQLHLVSGYMTDHSKTNKGELIVEKIRNMLKTNWAELGHTQTVLHSFPRNMDSFLSQKFDKVQTVGVENTGLDKYTSQSFQY